MRLIGLGPQLCCFKVQLLTCLSDFSNCCKEQFVFEYQAYKSKLSRKSLDPNISMSFWRKDKSLIIQDTVEDASNGINDAGEIQQEKNSVSHGLHPGELSLEEDIAGGLSRHLGVTSTTFLMCN